YRQMAVEFNQKGLRRIGGKPWTGGNIKTRVRILNELDRERAQDKAKEAETAPAGLQKSA
ncbi:MAG TPA: hypothetical protein VEG60_21375, partial [Candidatus Binatia bacterium]|nr:hypothetical protein [Candidatus Binatia bacterium]